MKKNNYGFLIWFALVAVVVFGAAIGLKGRQVVAPGGVMAENAAESTSSPVDSTPDDVSLAPLPDGDVIVANASAGYYFSMPTNWYEEQDAGPGITIYPDYDPKSGDTPECKIELSTLTSGTVGDGAANAGANADNLDAWLTQYLHADPTASVAEISHTPISVGETGDTGSDEAAKANAAIEWRGTLNNMTTTLVYVAMPTKNANTSSNILEIAPSTLSEASDADNDDCDFDLQALVANLEFGNYEP